MNRTAPAPPSLALRVLAALLAAAALSLLVPPFGLHWLHWVVYLPMFWALREDTPRANRWLGHAYGVVAQGLLFRWLVDTITIFSNLPWLAAVGVILLFAIVFGLPYVLIWGAVHPLRRRLGTWWVLALPALAVLVEWLSSFVLLFPYNHGVSQYRTPFLWQTVSVTGIWGLTWLLFFVNAAVAEIIYRRREGRPLALEPLAAALALPSVAVMWGAWRYEQLETALTEAQELRVAQLQSADDMVVRMQRSRQIDFDSWVAKTRAVPRGAADLVVWPEGACPYDINAHSRVRRQLGALAKDGRFELVVGGGTRERHIDASLGEERVRTFNSVYFFDDEGEVAGRYDKMVPLPFGEYLPLAEQLPWLADLIEGPGSFRAGDTPVVFEGQELRIATPICYEAILGRVCRSFEKPDLVVNVTNDAWFGDTAAPYLHAMLAAVRAVELGVPVYRSAYTGVSMVIEPHGHIHSETEPFTEVQRLVTIRSASFPTLYARWGDWFVALCAAGLALAWWWAPEREVASKATPTP